MNIHPITDIGQVGKNSGSSRSGKISAPRPSVSMTAGDKVELVSSHDRDIVLNSIKAKVKQGFYKSEDVTDDISEKLAHLFDRI